jgi:hypothetical protein
MIPHKLSAAERDANFDFSSKIAYAMFGLIYLIVVLSYIFTPNWSVSTKIFASLASGIPIMIGVAIIRTKPADEIGVPRKIPD